MSKTVIGTMISVAVVAGLVGGALSGWLISRGHRQPPQSLTAQELTLVEKDGTSYARFSANSDGEGGSLDFVSSSGGGITLSVGKDGDSFLILHGGAGFEKISLVAEGTLGISLLSLYQGDSGEINLQSSKAGKYSGPTLELTGLNKHQEGNFLPASLNLSLVGDGASVDLYPEAEVERQGMLKTLMNRRPLLSFGFADNEKPYMGLFDKKGRVKWAVP
jgi:hypothetical protein